MKKRDSKGRSPLAESRDSVSCRVWDWSHAEQSSAMRSSALQGVNFKQSCGLFERGDALQESVPLNQTLITVLSVTTAAATAATSTASASAA